MQGSTGEKNQVSVSGTKLPKLDEQVTSENLPKNVSLQLYELMKQVVADEVTPGTVNAACNCATAIHKFLKFNEELKRSKS